MPDHDGRHACRDQSRKRREVLGQLVPRSSDRRVAEVRIGTCPPLTGEVLRAREQASVAEAADERLGAGSGDAGVVGKRAVADRAVGRPAVKVDDRSQVPVDAAATELLADGLRMAAQLILGPAGKRSRRRLRTDDAAEGRDAAAFLVDGDERIGREDVPELRGELRDLASVDDVAIEQEDSPWGEFAKVVEQPRSRGGVVVDAYDEDAPSSGAQRTFISARRQS